MLSSIKADELWDRESEPFVGPVSFGRDDERISFDQAIEACERLVATTLAAFDVVAVLTQGGPLRTTQVFATYTFAVGILSGDMPLGASVVGTKP
jgi:hypothetical protein